MRLSNIKEEIDFCEDCGKDVPKQKVRAIECDCGFYHFVCSKCFKRKKYSVLAERSKE